MCKGHGWSKHRPITESVENKIIKIFKWIYKNLHLNYVFFLSLSKKKKKKITNVYYTMEKKFM